MLDFAKKILTVGVLSILITAPLGSILIHNLGPILLQFEEEENEVSSYGVFELMTDSRTQDEFLT